jgi:hypothetical protein
LTPASSNSLISSSISCSVADRGHEGGLNLVNRHDAVLARLGT